MPEWVAFKYGCFGFCRTRVPPGLVVHFYHSCWVMISQELINDAIGQWSKRLLLVVYSHNEHTEHLLC